MPTSAVAVAVVGDRREMIIPGLNAAAKKIQCLFRAKHARYVLRCERPAPPSRPVKFVRRILKMSTTSKTCTTYALVLEQTESRYTIGLQDELRRIKIPLLYHHREEVTDRIPFTFVVSVRSGPESSSRRISSKSSTPSRGSIYTGIGAQGVSVTTSPHSSGTSI